MKLYRITSEPFYRAGSTRYSFTAEDSPKVGDIVKVSDPHPDASGDLYDDTTGLWINPGCLTEITEANNDRAALVRQAREILGTGAPVDSLIKLADYLAGGAA